MQHIYMMRAIGFVIVLYALSHMMSESFHSFENAVTATFETVQVAATISKYHMLDEAN